MQNMIFKIDKLDKWDELVDTVKYLAINDAKYYESKTAPARSAQSDLTRNPDTVTHTINRNKTVVQINNGNLKKHIE